MRSRLLPIALLLLAGPACAQTLFKCVSASGHITFQDHGCDVAAQQTSYGAAKTGGVKTSTGNTGYSNLLDGGAIAPAPSNAAQRQAEEEADARQDKHDQAVQAQLKICRSDQEIDALHQVNGAPPSFTCDPKTGEKVVATPNLAIAPPGSKLYRLPGSDQMVAEGASYYDAKLGKTCRILNGVESCP